MTAIDIELDETRSAARTAAGSAAYAAAKTEERQKQVEMIKEYL